MLLDTELVTVIELAIFFSGLKISYIVKIPSKIPITFERIMKSLFYLVLVCIYLHDCTAMYNAKKLEMPQHSVGLNILTPQKLSPNIILRAVLIKEVPKCVDNWPVVLN